MKSKMANDSGLGTGIVGALLNKNQFSSSEEVWLLYNNVNLFTIL